MIECKDPLARAGSARPAPSSGCISFILGAALACAAGCGAPRSSPQSAENATTDRPELPASPPAPLLAAPASELDHVEWSGDGQVLAYASGSAVTRLWIRTGRALLCATDQLDGILTLRMDADGHTAVAGGRGSSLASMCDERGRDDIPMRGYYGGTGEDTTAEISRDGSVVTSEASLRYRPGTNPSYALEDLFEDMYGRYDLCPGGSTLFGTRNAHVIAVSLPSATVVELEGESRFLDDVECTPDEAFVVDRAGGAWSLGTGRRVPVPEIGGDPPFMRTLRPGPEAGQIVMQSRGTAYVISVPENRVVREVLLGGPFSFGSGGRLATAHGSTIRVEAGGETRELDLGSTVRALAWHPTADVLAVAVEGSGLLLVRSDGLRARVGIVTTEQGERFVLVDDEGHFDGPEEALSVLQVRLGPDGPTRAASEVDPRWRAPIRATLMRW